MVKYRLWRAWRDLQRAYAKRYVCPYWGHQEAGAYGWSRDDAGKWDKQAALKGTCENCGGVIPVMKLDEVPDHVSVVWWGKAWDKEGCKEDIRIEPPSGEICHGCLDQLGERSSGVASRDDDGRWLFFDPSCWGDAEAERYAKETLDADYADRPGPDAW